MGACGAKWGEEISIPVGAESESGGERAAALVAVNEQSEASMDNNLDDGDDDMVRPAGEADRSSLLEVIAEEWDSNYSSDEDPYSDSDAAQLPEAQSAVIRQLAASDEVRRQLQHSIETSHCPPSPVESTTSSGTSSDDEKAPASGAAEARLVHHVSRGAALVRWGRRRNARRRKLNADARLASQRPTEYDFVLRKHGSAGKLFLLLDERVRRQTGVRRLVVSGLPRLPGGEPGPAEACGMRIGDELVAVGGRDVCGKSMRVCVALFQAVPGSVAVRVARPSTAVGDGTRSDGSSSDTQT